jgi:hypothetical protein
MSSPFTSPTTSPSGPRATSKAGKTWLALRSGSPGLPSRGSEGPAVRARRFNDAVLEAVYIKDRRIGRTEFSEVFAPLFSCPRSNTGLKVEVAGVEPA